MPSSAWGKVTLQGPGTSRVAVQGVFLCLCPLGQCWLEKEGPPQHLPLFHLQTEATVCHGAQGALGRGPWMQGARGWNAPGLLGWPSLHLPRRGSCWRARYTLGGRVPLEETLLPTVCDGVVSRLHRGHLEPGHKFKGAGRGAWAEVKGHRTTGTKKDSVERVWTALPAARRRHVRDSAPRK